MSGTIEISDEVVWMPAGWVYDNVLELIASELEIDDPSLSKILLEARTDMSSGYLDLRTLDADQFRLLIRTARRVYDRLVKEGPATLHAPSFYAGFIDRFKEFLMLLQVDARAVPECQ